MNDKTKISLVGLDSLRILGLRILLAEEKDCQTDNFSSFVDFEPFSDKAAGYIVAGKVFMENLDFFLPRKSRTLVVAEGRGEKATPAGIGFIYPEADETEIKANIARFVKSLRGGEPHGELSAREVEVLRLIAKGKINKEIADELCISINTVITHRKNLSSKLGVKSASGLSLYAMMNGII